MTEGQCDPAPRGALRCRAEARLAQEPNEAALSAEETRHLMHELRMHQVELEMQNEELLRGQEELQQARDRYADLYDFAPVGYLTVGEKGMIEEVNLTGAMLLGMERESLLGRGFSDFIVREDQDLFYLHQRQVVGTRESRTCELRLQKRDGTSFDARLECRTRGEEERGACFLRIAVSDITGTRQMEQALRKTRDELEQRVEERTGELLATNEHLQEEIEERQRSEEQLHVYQRELRSLAAALVLAEERERRRIAAELHDHIGQSLALAQLRLGPLRAALSSAACIDELDQVRQDIDQMLEEVRSLTFELSPPILYELGLLAAVEWLGEHFQKQHELYVRVEDDGQAKPLEEEVRVFLFRAVRELLVNVVKHAGVAQARVILRLDGKRIGIVVEDDGVGFAPTDFDAPRKFGLFSIRDRLDLLGGSFRVEAAPGQGTRVELVAPLQLADEGEEVEAE